MRETFQNSNRKEMRGTEGIYLEKLKINYIIMFFLEHYKIFYL